MVSNLCFICPNCRKRITEKNDHVIGYARGETYYMCEKKKGEK